MSIQFDELTAMSCLNHLAAAKRAWNFGSSAESVGEILNDSYRWGLLRSGLSNKSNNPPPVKMQRKAILNVVEKQKGFVDHAVHWNEDRSALLVSLRPHGRSRPICSRCGRKGAGYDTLALRRFEFVPLWAIPVFFFYAIPATAVAGLKFVCTDMWRQYMNVKAKLAIRKADGFKSYETIETALYHQLGNLPEPIQAHRFC